MTTLVLASTTVDTRYIGYDLRVAKLCEGIQDELHLVVAPVCPRPHQFPTRDNGALFASVTECPPILGQPQSLRRHLRRDNLGYMRLSRPREFTETRRIVSDIVSERDIARIVVFGGDLVELVADIRSCPKVLDVCDSVALTQKRLVEHAGRFGRGRPADELELYRARRTEARFPALFDHVTTVSDVDTAEIVGLSGTGANVHTVPNGVDEEYLKPMPSPGNRRGVVFWGNLAFAPNADGLRYFLDSIWYPRLRQRGVQLSIVGGNAPDWLVGVAEREPLIELTGFVRDLRAGVSRYPVMINPMLTGSGLKNKMLEAFGLGIAVVSTARGAEGVPAARSGEHLEIADGPSSFADATLALLGDPVRRTRLRANANALVHERYDWSSTMRPWQALFAVEESAGSNSRRVKTGSVPERI